jgi:16S rRNA (guanine966-N2)-methyltransferase
MLHDHRIWWDGWGAVTRIISGAARGRRLAVPPGTSTRPTSDRAREALFSTIEALIRSFAGARVLDLYAGSGAVGLEALSRGADHVLLVESDARAAAIIRANAATIGLDGAEVRSERVELLAARGAPTASYDVAFLDPPYEVADDALREVITDLLDGAWLSETALVVVERATRGGEWGWPAGIAADRSRRYGEATLWYGRAARHARVQDGLTDAQPVVPQDAIGDPTSER